MAPLGSWMRRAGKCCLPVYDEIQSYGQGLFRVQANGKWGVVSDGDKQVIPLEYDYVGPLRENVAVVKSGVGFGIVNSKGVLVSELIYDKIRLEENVGHAYRGDRF